MGKITPPALHVLVKFMPVVCTYCGRMLQNNKCEHCNLIYKVKEGGNS